MSTHTPGPWELFEHSWSDSSICGGVKNSKKICSLSIYDDATEENQSELESEMDANARLIAAAPELLEALQECVIELDCLMKTRPAYQGGMNMVERAKSAIAKATGKESA